MTTVCIEDKGDGTYSVYQETDDDSGDAAAQMGSPDAGASPAAGAAPAMPGAPASTDDEANEPGAQTADNVDDALALAKQMLEQGGDDQGDDDNPANGSTPLDPDQAKAMWSQMAAKKQKAKASMGAM